MSGRSACSIISRLLKLARIVCVLIPREREFETMNYPDAAADPWCCYSNNAGEAAAAAAVPTSGEEASRFFGDMVAAADYSTYVIYDYYAVSDVPLSVSKAIEKPRQVLVMLWLAAISIIFVGKRGCLNVL
jgi:hypothetical protein